MANRKRNIMIRFRVTPEEKTMIEEKPYCPGMGI